MAAAAAAAAAARAARVVALSSGSSSGYSARGLRTCAAAAAGARFEAAVAALKTLKTPPTDLAKLQLYALFKQATVGPNTTSKPGLFDFVGTAKWHAWKELDDMSTGDAEAKYIAMCESLGVTLDGSAPAAAAAAPAAAAAAPAAGAADSAAAAAGLTIKTAGRVRTIVLNRPEKRNAITIPMYNAIVAALDDAAADPAITVTVITGAGPFFCSGNDLSTFATMPPGGPTELAATGRATLHKFVDRFITFPKLLVAAVNGPAVGIAVTTLPLYDAVFASAKATLHAPLTALGQSPEGCSSVTFPRAVGPARAADLILLGRKASASEAAAWGLVNEVYEDAAFEGAVAAKVAEYAALPPGALLQSKAMMRSRDIPALQAANTAECDLIAQRWLSAECMAAITSFMTKGGKK